MVGVEHGVLAVYLAGCALFAVANLEALVKTFEPHSSHLDWCEDNYEVSDHVVEFWNTVSSLSLVAVAFIAPRFIGGKVREHEPNIWFMWSLMVLVGVGSVLFHGTLSVAGQVLDELPISLVSMFGVFLLKPLHKWNMRVRGIVFTAPFLIAMVVSATLLSLLYPVVSHIMCLSWIPIILYSYSTEYVAATDAARKQAYPMFIMTLVSFGVAWGSWLLDKFFCHEVQATLGYNPQLHAWWHVAISYCFWTLVTLGVILRCHGDKVELRIRDGGLGMPFLDVGKTV